MLDPEAIYNLVLRMVLWGESREEVLHKLKVNGITGEEADTYYKRAYRERVATIRAPYWKKLGVGMGFLGWVMGGFCFMWFYIGGITHQLLYICAAAAAVGLLLVVLGIFGIMGAPSKEGAITD